MSGVGVDEANIERNREPIDLEHSSTLRANHLPLPNEELANKIKKIGEAYEKIPV